LVAAVFVESFVELFMEEAAHKEFGALLRTAAYGVGSQFVVAALWVRGTTILLAPAHNIVRMLRPNLVSLPCSYKSAERQIPSCLRCLGLLHQPEQRGSLESGHPPEVHVKDLSLLRGEVDIIRSDLLLIDYAQRTW